MTTKSRADRKSAEDKKAQAEALHASMVADIDDHAIAETAQRGEQYGARTLVLRCNTTRSQDITAALDTTIDTFGRRDIAFK